jgi:hypothetical protein
VIANPAEDPLLRWQAVRFDPPREQDEPKGDVIERAMRELGADGEWHSRGEAEESCIGAGAGAGTFAARFPKLDFIETEKRSTEKGQEVWWRLK